ncbi:hypothetical protein COK00_00100 [Bacillus cereus]|uniref:hypothetical protein n=1 Tax=Bacillus cereus TaxID=1396 RepID=UPI000BECFC33|nr:hypothetical protein [Bacillus cereus]PEC86621.1 hypothetical protein CON28_04520 [Bacillus cereus]PEX38149.1 hypothetical protein CN455_13910 [Bacillus cereus]PFB10034.1 hypothetical protein CN399_29765 [Bacillus cereus]PFP69047.1 hypothetical protein COK00_00100 [Bacillus cereus]PFV53859.1 hypothetical protein COL09_25220 [Bacillus cereus]
MSYLTNISNLVFIERKHVFEETDIMLYHPGHFPELNEFIAKHYSKEKVHQILIPYIYNKFLQANEFEYHKKILVKLGIPQEIIQPIKGEFSNVHDVVKTTFETINYRKETNVLLAGKSFFSRRFLLLASLYASNNMVLDVLPLQDSRKINKDTWHLSEKGKQRVLNEVKQYSEIIENNIASLTQV